MKLLGLPVFGFWLPFIGRVRIYLNRDGSIVDTGAADMRDERGPVYVEPWSVEWLGFGMPFTPATPRDTLTGELVRLG
jgi:hypothetical protein